MIFRYSETFYDHFTSPRNIGRPDGADICGEYVSGLCGDSVNVYLRLKDGVIEDIGYNVCGCSVAVAAASITSELIKGKTPEQALALTDEEIADKLGGVPEEKIQCSFLMHKALENALLQAGQDS